MIESAIRPERGGGFKVCQQGAMEGVKKKKKAKTGAEECRHFIYLLYSTLSFYKNREATYLTLINFI